MATIPDTPTFVEQGLKDFVVVSWVALMAPAGTPQPIVRKLHAETVEALKDATVRQRFETLGIEPVGNTPEQFAADIKADMARWKEVVERAGIKVE